jgi:hypothetical protein
MPATKSMTSITSAMAFSATMDLLGINSIHHGLRPDHGGHAQEQINYGEIHYIITAQPR